jgi:protein STE50
LPYSLALLIFVAADSNGQEIAPTQGDIAKIISIIKERDAEMRSLREDLAKISEENRKLREEVLPLVRAAKDRSQPLPLPTPDESSELRTSVVQGLSRKFSNKRIFLSNPSGIKNANPSPTIQERVESSALDPSPAALAASNHLQVRDGLNSPNQLQTSPTSPAYNSAPSSAGPTSRPFPRDGNSDYGVSMPTPALSASAGPPGSISTPPANNPPASVATTPSGGSGPPIEIFKSFRVSIDDPCHKVLPVALKKYNISADWRQYALYIVHGDQERCLGLNEKPLILFKQLDKEGRKPMFMLRKHAAPQEGHVSVGGGPPQSISAANLPGGVL